MAASCGIAYGVLAWTAEWYLREETLREADVCLVNYHHPLPMIAMFGSGTLSSSDGQRFPTRSKSITARHLNKYFVSEGISTYTHVSDQHSTFGTKVIVATHREAHYVLDEILGNATDLAPAEYLVHAGHAACLYSWRMPPRRSWRRMWRRLSGRRRRSFGG